MYKANKKLYYKLFDLYRHYSFINNLTEANRLNSAMLNIKKNYNLDLRFLDKNELINRGFDSVTISEMLEFFTTQELKSFNNLNCLYPGWISDLILSQVFDISDLQFIFNSEKKIESKNELLSHIESDYFVSKFGLSKQKTFLRYLDFVFYDKFPLYIRNNESILDLDSNKVNGCKIYGSFHNHTLYSDGSNTIQELVDENKKIGKSYLGISDHSISQFLSGGLTELDIEKQHKEINSFNNLNSDFKLFKSIECEILKDGKLDYRDDILTKFDYVIISVHTHLYQSRIEATKRLINAIENPNSNILGHPTGRCYRRSPGLDVDMFKIIDACVANNVIIEINGDKDRLDLDIDLLNYAENKGALFSLEADAHSLFGLNSLKYAIFISEKANLNPAQCINTFSYEKINSTFSII